MTTKSNCGGVYTDELLEAVREMVRTSCFKDYPPEEQSEKAKWICRQLMEARRHRQTNG